MSPETQPAPVEQPMIEVPQALLPANTETEDVSTPVAEVITVPDFIKNSVEKPVESDNTGIEAGEVHSGPSYTNESARKIAEAKHLQRMQEMSAMSKFAVETALRDNERRGIRG